jgi:hypothetical protein
VEAGDMTRDLAILVGANHPWVATNQLLDKTRRQSAAGDGLNAAKRPERDRRSGLPFIEPDG